MAADPPDAFHALRTVDRLLELLPQATRVPAFPASPRPEFAAVRESFLDALLPHLR